MVSRRRGGSPCSIRSCARLAPRIVASSGAVRRLKAAFDAAGAPTQAATAFARNCAVPVADLERLVTDKGAWLVFRGTEHGAATTRLLGDIINQAIAALPIAKRMRWGGHTAEFVRPVHTVVLLYGDEVVPVEVLGAHLGQDHARPPVSLATADCRSPRPVAMKAGCAAPRCLADFACAPGSDPRGRGGGGGRRRRHGIDRERAAR